MKKRIIKSATHVATYICLDEEGMCDLDEMTNWRLEHTVNFDRECDLLGGWYVFPIILLAKYDPDVYLQIVSQYDNIENYVGGLFGYNIELFKINED